MNRLTNRDWHITKFMGLNEREVLYKLWQLENEFYKETKFKSGDTVFYIKTKGFGATVEEARELIIESDKIKRVCIRKTKITYYLKHRKSGINENILYSSREEAEKRMEELKRTDKQ